MLTNPQVTSAGRRRRPQSLKQQYVDFVQQRIEEYKDDLTRADLLTLGDEAVRELRIGERDQLVLTEVLLRDHVNERIKSNLRLPKYRAWRERLLKLRRAQQEPTHWGLDPDAPLAELAACLEESEVAVVIGVGAASAGFALAAHDIDVILVDGNLATIQSIEDRAKSEWLETHIEGLVVDLAQCSGQTLRALLQGVPRRDPEIVVALVVIDAVALGRLDATHRTSLIRALKEHTVRGGAHLIPPPPQGMSDVIPIAPDALQSEYSGWITDRQTRHARSRWFSARRP
jgi:hypothetical protein